MEFALLEPVDSSLVEITPNNLEDELVFSWESSIDPDMDEVTYTFIGSDGLSIILFEPTTDTSLSISYWELEELTHTDESEIITGSWFIRSSDGEEITETLWFALTIDASSVGIDEIIVPDNFALSPAYPNPFNPSTTISYQLPAPNSMILVVYNVSGQRVATLVNGKVNTGYHQITWNAHNQPSGLYFVQMVAGDYVSSQKILLMK